MNTNLQIYVRVINAATAQLGAITGNVNALTGSLGRATIASRNFDRALLTGNLEKWGKNLQWVGRQIEYSFTLPLALAGAEALKTSNANEAAFTRLVKVYGTGIGLTKQQKVEVQELRKAFVALSDIMGISQADITNIAADWAAAGSSGAQLAQQTRITAEAMLLGEMSAKDATQALIAISAQYKLNASQLKDTVGILNAIENQTGATFSGLIDAFQRAAGFAVVAGVDVRHLGADIAALTPAAGSAVNAGNALKTIFSRILSPTTQASDIFALLGININSAAWASQTAQDRLITLAKATQNLTSGQRAQFDTIVAGRFQISRFSTLLGALIDQHSFYQKALDATSSKQKIAAQYTYELSTVLASQPQTFQILKVRLQNALVQGFTPLVPAIESVVGGFVALANKFAQMDPQWQKLILYLLTALALFGPLLRYVGATGILLARLGRLFVEIGFFAVVGFAKAAQAVLWFSKILLAPIGVLADLAVILASGFTRALLAALPIMASVAGTVFSVLGNTLRILWTASMIALEAVTVGTGAALQAIWAIVVSGIGAITVGWGTAFRLLWATLFTSIQVLAGVWGSGFAVFWRAFLTEIEVLTTAWGRIFKFIWAGVMTAIEAITIAVGASIRTIWAGVVLFFGSFELWGRAIAIVATAMSSIGRVILTGVIQIGARIAPLFLEALTSPITWAVIGAIAIFAAFRKQIADIFRNIGRDIMNAFHALPEGVQSAFKAVFNIIVAAVKAISSWLSELNPFKRHSPSLVDNVKAGTREIAKHYSGVGKAISSPMSEGIDALNGLKSATAPALAGIEQAGLVSQRAEVVAAAPGAGAAYDAAAAAMQTLERTLPAAEAAISRQEAVVAKWKTSLDGANAALDAQNTKLKLLQDTANQYSDQLSIAQDHLKKFTDAPITGMHKLDEQIFANTQQTNELQLSLLKLQQNAGVTDLASQLSKVNGELEQLRGNAKNLHALGAGSDILGPITDQVKTLEAQAGTLQNSADSYNQISRQLAAAQQQGQILNLTKSVTFDPLTHSIENLTNTTKELPIEQIIAGIKKWQPEVTKNQIAYDNATLAVKQQQIAVDQLTSARDVIQQSYDIENNKLTKLNDTYQANVDLVNKLKDAMNALSSAQGSSKGPSAADQAFAAAGAGDFAAAGGAGFSLASATGDQTGAINDIAKKWQDEANKAFGGMDLFGPIKQMWNSFVKWINKATGGWASRAVGDIVSGFEKLFGIGTHNVNTLYGEGIKNIKEKNKSLIGEFFGAAGHAVTDFFTKNRIGKDIAKWVSEAVRDIGGFFKTVWDILSKLWKLFGPDLEKIGRSLVGILKPLGGLFKDLFQRLGPLFKDLWTIIKPIAAIIGVILVGAFKVLTSVLADTVGPAFHIVFDVLKIIIDTFSDLIHFVADIFTGKWGDAFKTIGRYFSDTFGGMYRIIKDTLGFLWGLVKGVVEGIVHFFQWLYDMLVGHSIIPDLVNGIRDLFQWLWDVIKAIWNGIGAAIQWVWHNLIKPVWDGMKWVWDNVLYPMLKIQGKIFSDIWNGIGDSIKWVWHNVISPIWDSMKWAWDHILKPMLDEMKNIFWDVWNGIGTAIDWVWNNVILKVYHALDDAWNNILKKMLNNLISGFTTIFNALGDAVAIGINVAIRALDAVIGGVNWVLKHIGLGSPIPNIPTVGHPHWKAPQLAAGGVAPFRTDGIRAIVGEGNPAYPEYVIPTDPQYRTRARALHEEAANRLFAAGGQLPNTTVEGGKRTGSADSGGNLGPIIASGTVGGGFFDKLGAAADGLIDLGKKGIGFIRKGAVIVALAPFLKAFDEANKLTPKDILGINAQKWMNDEKNRMYNWAKGDPKVNRDFGPNWEKNPPLGFSSWAQWAMQGQYTGDLGQNAWQEIIQFGKLGPNFTTALPGLDRGGHSYHESGNAIDFSGGNLDDIAKYWYQYYGYLLEEIHSPSWYVKNGQQVGAGFYGPDIVAQHYNHVHIAATKAAMDKLLAQNATLGAVGLGGSAESIQDRVIGQRMAAAMGWTGGQWNALDALWTRESGWQWSIGNTSSGAYGIPQALPASKMASAGGDWRTNPATQIRWGLQYIKDVYGTPENAWNAWLARGGSPYGHWYGAGGILPDYPSLAAGGIVKATPGGVLVRVAEGGRDERIEPLPNNSGGGGQTINIYGNLEFPNIKSGNDAGEFIKNLRVLAKRNG